jgi:hypothetical protein
LAEIEMKPLVLTGRWTPEFMEHGLADLVLDLALFDFVWGPQPSSDQLADHLGPRTDHHTRERGATHWSDWEPHRRKHRKHRNRSLAEFCQRSRLSLTEFGKAIVAHKEDFSRHNPIERWWGGTHLTNDNLWRWNPALVKP